RDRRAAPRPGAPPAPSRPPRGDGHPLDDQPPQHVATAGRRPRLDTGAVRTLDRRPRLRTAPAPTTTRTQTGKTGLSRFGEFATRPERHRNTRLTRAVAAHSASD